MYPTIFFMRSLFLQFYLIEIQLDGCLSTEYAYHDPEFHFFFIHILYKPAEIIEWTVDYFYGLAGTERNLKHFNIFAFLHSSNETLHLVRLQCHRLAPRSHETDHRR